MFAHTLHLIGMGLGGALALAVVICFARSWRYIAPNQQGVVQLNFGTRKLSLGQIIALNGECGYQARTLSPGWNFVIFPFYSVTAVEVVENSSVCPSGCACAT